MIDHITILGKKYSVVMTDDVGSGGNLGNSKRSKQVITLNGEQCAPEQLEETLLHEVIHMVDGELAMGLPEETIARLSVGIYSAGYRYKEQS
jgi:hypothetical protein